MEKLSQKMGIQREILTPDEESFLDQHGYLSLGRLMDDNQLSAVRSHLQRLLAEEGKQAGSELLDSPYIRHPIEDGVDRMADLVNKGPIFDMFYTHPRLLAAVARVIGPELRLSSLNYRAALPGKGSQKLHADWHEAVSPGNYLVCNTIWLLDDFTKANGATRLVPDSHRSGILPQEDLDDPWATHPDEILVEAPAGTVVVCNSHTWHGGTVNRTDTPRRAIHSYFCRRDQPQQVDQQRYIRPETYDRLSEEARWVLDVTRPQN